MFPVGTKDAGACALAFQAKAECPTRGVVILPAGTKDWACRSVIASASRIKGKQNEPLREAEPCQFISHLQKNLRHLETREIRRKTTDGRHENPRRDKFGTKQPRDLKIFSELWKYQPALQVGIMLSTFMTTTPQTLTKLLSAWTDGDKAALQQLMPMIYQELHRLAARHLAHERVGHTLQATA